MTTGKRSKVRYWKPGDIIKAVDRRRGTITARVIGTTPDHIRAVILTGRWKYLCGDDEIPGDAVSITKVDDGCKVTILDQVPPPRCRTLRMHGAQSGT